MNLIRWRFRAPAEGINRSDPEKFLDADVRMLEIDLQDGPAKKCLQPSPLENR